MAVGGDNIEEVQSSNYLGNVYPWILERNKLCSISIETDTTMQERENKEDQKEHGEGVEAEMRKDGITCEMSIEIQKETSTQMYTPF